MKFKHILIAGLLILLMAQQGMATVSCCKNFTTSNGILFEDFETVSDWTVAGTNASVIADTNNFLSGTQGILLYTNNSSATVLTMMKTINHNFSYDTNFGFSFYLYNISNYKQIAIHFCSNTGCTVRIETYIFPTGATRAWVHNGWNSFIYNLSDFSSVGGGNISQNMVRLKIVSYPETNKLSNITFDNFILNYTARPKIEIQFDDGANSAINNAYPIMQANNQVGTAFVITNWIGKGGSNMTIDNLSTLKQKGWAISSHTSNHATLTNLNDTVLDSELLGSQTWLQQNGFASSSYKIAYPGGTYNQTVIDAVKKYYVFGRSVIQSTRELHPDSNIKTINNNYQLKTFEIWNTTTTDAINASVDDVISQNGILRLEFHNIDTNSSQYRYSTNDFLAISNYIASKQALGLVDVITGSDYILDTNIYYSTNSSQLISNNISVTGINTFTTGLTYIANVSILPTTDNIVVNITTYNSTLFAFTATNSTAGQTMNITVNNDVFPVTNGHSYHIKKDGIYQQTMVASGNSITFTNISVGSDYVIEEEAIIDSIAISKSNTCSGISSYIPIVIPLFGLALMIFAFGVIFIQLKFSSNPSPEVISTSIIVSIVGFGMLLIGNYLIYSILNVTGC